MLYLEMHRFWMSFESFREIERLWKRQEVSHEEYKRHHAHHNLRQASQIHLTTNFVLKISDDRKAFTFWL